MRRMFALVVVLLAIAGCSGCSATLGLQGASQQIPGAVGQLDDAVYAIAIAKYQAAQRFQAEVNGTMPTLPPLPAPVPTPAPTSVPAPTPVSKPPAPVPVPKPVPTVP